LAPVNPPLIEIRKSPSGYRKHKGSAAAPVSRRDSLRESQDGKKARVETGMKPHLHLLCKYGSSAMR